MMKFRRSARDVHDEGGATIVIVALALIAMFGMVVLVVDVGGLLWKRRELVNGSDAAALSAASTCAKLSTIDPRTAEQAADQLAAENVTGLNPTTVANTQTAPSTCHTTASGWVKVQYSQQQHLYFAPVLGFSNQNGVTTKATAIWGPAGAANPVPIVVYAHSFNDCQLDNDPTPGPTCYIWEDNNNTQGSQSGFGLLDLRTDNPSTYGWDSVAGASCPNPGSDVKNWIDNYPSSQVGNVGVNYPNPTYVCRVSGANQVTWDSLNNLVDDDDVVDQNDQEDILYFPINRCDNVLPGQPFGQIAADTSEVACGNIPNQYDIIGFVALKLKAIYRPNQVQGSSGTCAPNNSPVTMINGTTVVLDTFGSANGCYSSITGVPDAYSNIKVVKHRSNDPGPQPVQCPGLPTPTCDWTYDSVSRTITWNAAGPANENIGFDVAFDWVQGGPCGIPPSGNNSGHCMVVQVVDIQIGGGCVGCGSPTSNIRAIKLCDQSIAGSCDAVTVPNP